MTKNVENLTDQQRAAIETSDVSIALSAGAGCGKTFVLTRRFLTELEPNGQSARPARSCRKTPAVKVSASSAAGVDRSKIRLEEPSADVLQTTGGDLLHGLVAITFTERAAREMRDRIRAACHAKLLECADAEISHWQGILRGLDTARISTIHAFCASFLRSHAVESGIDPQFSVLEAATGDVVLRRAVNRTLQTLVVEKDRDAIPLVLHFGLEKTHEFVRKLVQSRFRSGPDDLSERDPRQHADDWRKLWDQKYRPLLLNEFVRLPIVVRTLELLTRNEPSHPKMQQRRQLLLQQLPEIADAADLNAAFENLLEAAKVQGGGNKDSWSDATIFEAVKNAFEKLRGAIRKVADEIDFDDKDLLDAVTFGLMFFRVAQKAAEEYEAQKKDAGFLDFDDLLVRTRDLLRDHELVRARAARGIDLIMVDEFQDTDPVQSEIIKHLCGGDVTGGKLFLVGDAKQSIYRFRNADPGVFAALRDAMPSRGRLPLSTNFRSQPEILDFVNALFARPFGDSYEPLVAHVKQTTPPPAIEFLFSSATGDDDTGGRESAESRRRREADWIARRISGLLIGDERPVRTSDHETKEHGDLRRAKPGDIAILFRALSSVAIYEEALREHGIEYYLVGGRAFFAQQEIFDVVNLFSSLDNPDDEVSLAGVLRSPFFSLRDDSLLAMVESAGTLRAVLAASAPAQLSEHQQERIRYASQVLAELYDRKDRIPLAALLKLAIERTGYDAALLNEFLGRRKIANLQKLLDMARQFDRAGLATMGEFVGRLRDSVLEQTDEELAATHPETSNVVRLMTVHQSKGLEFPVVFVADMDSARPNSNEGPVHHATLGPLIPLPRYRGEPRKNVGMKMKQLEDSREDELEKLRLLYVATTRAADLLLLSAGLEPSRKLRSPWMQLVAERFDIDTGLPNFDPYLGRTPSGDVLERIPAIRVHRAPPPIVRGQATSKAPLPLKDFRESVEAAEPLPLPEILRKIEPQPGPQTILSVTSIDQTDRRIRPAALAKPVAVRFDEEIDDVTDDVDEDHTGRNLGTLVHAMLERIDPRRENDLSAVARHAAYRVFRKPEESLESAAIARVSAFLLSDAFRDIAGAKRILREVEIVLRWPRKGVGATANLISGTIDCLAEMPDGRWLLIDYKTGRMPLSEPGAVRERYGLQLAIYAMATEELIGRIPDRAEIIAVQDHVERFELDVSASFLSAVSQRIDAAVERLMHPPSQ